MPAFRAGLIAFALLISGSVAHAQSRGVDSLVPSQRTLNRLGLERMWWGQTVLNPSRDTVSHITLDEEMLYVQATSGTMTAFDSETGARRWVIQLGRGDGPQFPAISNEDTVMVVVGTSIFAVDKATGVVAWKLRLPGQPSTSPAADANNVYVGMLDGTVYAFDLRKVRTLYLKGMLPEWSQQAQRWRFKAAKEITSPPLPMGRVVAFAGRAGSLYVVTAETLKLVFQFETDAPISAGLARRGDTLYLASEDFTFYAINATTGIGAANRGRTGEVIWESISGVPIRKTPYIVGPDLFLMPERDGLHVISAATGQERWWQPRLTDFLAASTNLVFASDTERNLVVVSRSNGAIIGFLPLPRFTIRLHNDRTDRVYVATEAGTILALRQKGRGFPLFHQHPDRLPILPEFAPEEPAENTAPPANEAPANDSM